MGQVFFIADTHFNHNNILNFGKGFRQGTTVSEHNDWVVEQCNSVVKKADVLYVLGDVAFNVQGLDWVKKIRGQKQLILGNHDRFGIETYLKYFRNIKGMMKYKGIWLSHCPMHPQELLGHINVHGHVHEKSIPDDRYINVSVDARNGVPMSLDEVRDYEKALNSEDLLQKVKIEIE